jgi:hypothetical protein
MPACPPSFIAYRCPNIGFHVQEWFADDGSQAEGETFEAVTCTAWRQLHFVNPATGKVQSADGE